MNTVRHTVILCGLYAVNNVHYIILDGSKIKLAINQKIEFL